MGDNSDKVLKSYADRIASLMGEMKALKSDVKDELKAAQKQGIDVKALLRVVKELGMDSDQRANQLSFEFVLSDYRRAVGLPTAPPNEAQEAA